MSGLSGDTGSSMGNLGDMLALMANPAALKAKYDDLAKRQKAAEDAVALIGPASQIQQLRADAQKAKDEAKATLESAKTDAKRIAEQAKNSSDNIIAQANAKAEKLTREAEQVKAMADQGMKNAEASITASNKRNQELDSKAKDLADQQAALAAAKAGVDAARLANDDKAKKLKYVRDQLASALAEHGKYLNTV